MLILKIKCGELLSICSEFLKESNMEECELSYPEDFLENARNLADIKKRAIDLFLRVMRAAEAHKNTRSIKIIAEIRRLVDENYGDPEFKVSHISNYLYLNYSHICHLFSQYTGTTISDYLTEVRIVKSKELFDNGSVSVSSVSQRVGYTDANYFGKCFKKKYGISPSRYCQLHEKA
jgi:two-component system response regulator YesN